jgi:spore coat polysaccharide biosynthesis protein SpsF
MDLAGEPMLAHVIYRAQRARLVDHVMIATTDRPEDDPIADLAATLGVEVFRGSEHDVLSRYIGAARVSGADVIVRLTADCPLLDAGIVDAVIAGLDEGESAGGVDYASNVIARTFPRGLDVEAMFRDVLERVGRLARSAPAREHVTYFILREQPSMFRLRSISDTVDNSDLRWTVDELADLEMVRLLYRELHLAKSHLPYRDLLAWVCSRPDVASMNHDVQKA